ncbi:hypothetical protein FQA39_LY09860 [Lamprigera yunnana]|nr:hypothetical protein FQA39_LY09860 [Lamprigera yunnana]
MQGDDPPYLSVGTAVSAKYKGAFCEAKVSKVVRVVKCKVTYKMGLGTATVSDEQIKGPLRVGQIVQAKHLEKKEYVDATIMKIQDCSQYTVVFDDGDITTLRRTALCLKSGRHFNESETLDQLPLTHPEHFGNPVVGGRRGRRSRQLKEDSSEGEVEEENEPDLEVYTMEVGRVVCVEASDKKRNKDNWFPGLVVMPSAQPTVRINVKDEFLVRSFKDGRYYTVPQKEVTEFSRDMVSKIESTMLADAVEKVMRYLDNDELPVHWERSLLFHNSLQAASSDSDEHFTDSSEDETPEEKDHFVAQLYKFMDDSNTPLNKSPTIGNKDVDLHKLFGVVRKLGGYNRVTNKNKWRAVTLRLKLPNNLTTHNQVKLVYKKCLLSYEAFHRTLGVTMLNHPRNAKKSRGRSLIRDKDRNTPVNSPRPEKDEEPLIVEKKEEEKILEEKPKSVKKSEVKPKLEEEKKVKEISLAEISDTNSSDTTDLLDVTTNVSVRLRRTDSKSSRERKSKPPTGEKVKALVEKFEDQMKKEEKEDEKQHTRSKAAQAPKFKEKEMLIEKKICESKTPVHELPSPSKTPTKIVKKIDDEKKRGRKRTVTEEKEKLSLSDSTSESPTSSVAVGIGDKLKVYYGPTNESKVTYEAKVIEIDKETNTMYLVHYTGWNTRYDEWIAPGRIAENLSATTKAKKLKQGATAGARQSTPKSIAKRGRRISMSARSTSQEIPRSTTPSSGTSTSSRTKSPATPITRNFRSTRLGGELNRRTRRTSGQTDISNHSEFESDGSESESDTTKAKVPVKVEDSENHMFKKKVTKPVLKLDKRKDKEEEDTEKEEDVVIDKPKRTRKFKRMENKLKDSDEDIASPPKGRDFDLNQIRSELKGLVKPVKITTDSGDKEAISSDDSTNATEVTIKQSETHEVEKEKENLLQKCSSSDDIYEFKEPEPFEFESRTKLIDDKSKKRLVPRIFDEIDKSPIKRRTNSPIKVKDEVDVDKKRTRRTSIKKSELLDDDEDDDDNISIDSDVSKLVIEDPFDKLVESPSFHSGKEKVSNITLDEKHKVVKNLNLDEPLSLFHGLSETREDDSGDQLDISDTEESPNEPLFTHKEQLFTESTFSKASSDHSGLDPIFRGFLPKMDDRKQKDSDDDDAIRASIQSVINQASSTDDDSNDALLINPPFTPFQDHEIEVKPPLKPLTSCELEDSFKLLNTTVVKIETKELKPIVVEPTPSIKLISPALQESDCTLLEAICTPTEIITKLEEVKEINVKTCTKIADSLLQKFNMIQNEADENIVEISITEEQVKPEIIKSDLIIEPVPLIEGIKIETPEIKIKSEVKPKIETKQQKSVDKKAPEIKCKVMEPKVKLLETKRMTLSSKGEGMTEFKKRARKIVSREFIEESDTDSTDSEQRLVIARSDEESQTNSSIDVKVDIKESSNLSSADIYEVPIEYAFKFDTATKEESKLESKVDDLKREDEPDSHLHSLLLCEETIPGSPAPASEGVVSTEIKSKPKSILEMPFASAPGSSNNKSENSTRDTKSMNKERVQAPPLVHQIENRDKDNTRESSTVLDNTPPTTPESTLSNLSPRGDPGDLSTNTGDNESCKSGDGEGDYSVQKRISNKILPYSEEGSMDTLLNNPELSNSNKKIQDSISASPCRKRRRSCKGSDDVPLKRGRKPANRSRHNSDSDDTSEHSIPGNLSLPSGMSIDTRLSRSPKPSKYNFYVDLDPSLDSAQRIAILQQKLQEIRKTYADVKAELAAVERRRKKLRRREREAKLAAKQEALAT